MILPLADENAAGERAPWVTLGFIAACLACFVAAGGLQGMFAGPPGVELEQVVDYWLEHPYLEPQPAVIDAAAAAAGASDSAAFIAKARMRGALPPFNDELLDQEQSILAYNTGLALRGTDAKPGPEHPFRDHGLAARTPRAHAFLTHVFLHAGWLHLGLTLLLIWLAGPALELRLGRPIFAALCLASALAAAVTHLVTSPGAAAPMIGASGIAAGILGAFALRFGTGRVRLRHVALRGARPAIVGRSVPSWALLPFAVLVQLAFLQLFAGAEVIAGNAWPANLAGFATGGVLAVALRQWKVEERYVAPALAARSRAALDPRIKRAATALERGQHEEAITLAAAVLRERPEDPEALQASWDAHVAAGRAGDGARSARRLVELHARRGDLAPAARLWDELVRVAHRGRVESTTLLRIVPELVVQARRDAAIAALRAVIDPERTGLTVGQALRVAELGTELDPPTALLAARFALEHGDLVDERRARLEQLVLSLENAGVRVKAAPARAVAPAESDPAVERESELDAELDSELEIERTDLGVPEEPSAHAVEPPPPPSELFELEPTHLGVDESDAAEPRAPAPAQATPASPPPVTPPPAPPAPAVVEEGSATVLYSPPAAPGPGFATVKVTAAMPVALDVAGLRVRLEGGAPNLVEWTRIQAVAVGLISGLGAKPVVVIDLVLNWADSPDGALEVMRLRSDAFRARQLVVGAETALDALRAMLAQLLARSGAVPLPDANGARGLPFREYASAEVYQTQVLLSAS